MPEPAWGSLALQATLLGYQTHGMVGFDMERAFAELDLPEGCRVEQADRDRPAWATRRPCPLAMAAREAAERPLAAGSRLRWKASTRRSEAGYEQP